MQSYPEAYDKEHLQELINANDSSPNVAIDEVERLIDLAERRAQLRDEESTFDADDKECIIMTDWSGFAADEFGYDNGDMNQTAIGILNTQASAGKYATLFNDTVVVQNGWLETGDARRAKIEQYNDEDFEQASEGEMWVPDKAQEYMAIIALDPGLVHDDPKAADAM